MEQKTSTETRVSTSSKMIVAVALLAAAAGVAFLMAALARQNGVPTFGGRPKSRLTATSDYIQPTYLDLAASYRTACVVKVDGTVWCWGEQANFYNPSNVTASRYPLQVKLPNGSPLTGITSLAFGTNQNGPYCAVKSDNTVWCWGKDQQASSDNASAFTQVHQVMASASAPLTDVRRFAVGDQNSCALKLDNTVWCFGPSINYYGDKQSGTNKYYSGGVNYPTQITGGASNIALQNVIDVAVNNVFYAITDAKPIKKTWVWGDPTQLKWLGSGTAAPQVLPTTVPGNTATFAPYPNMIQLSASTGHACGIDIDHKVACWGGCDASSGIAPPNCLQVATTIGPTGPSDPTPYTDVVYISAGPYIDCAARNGGLWCWGQMGSYTNAQVSGNTNPYTKTPQEILYNGGSLPGVTKVVSGINFSCALKQKRTLLCWGDNSSNQLGTSMPDSSGGSNSPAIFPPMQ